jgi:hypothetical protein
MSLESKVRATSLKEEDLVHSKQIVLVRRDRARLDAETLQTFREKSLSDFSSMK